MDWQTSYQTWRLWLNRGRDTRDAKFCVSRVVASKTEKRNTFRRMVRTAHNAQLSDRQKTTTCADFDKMAIDIIYL
ncbi:MAG: hypothetical protein WCU80_06800 [Paludibacteraceae bacterium]|nr:hypothetical protein [Prevotellaceae bacterium]